MIQLKKYQNTTRHAVLGMLLLPAMLFAKPITPVTLFKTLKPGEPWDKNVLSATKTVLFNQTASGGTDATVIEQAQLGFFTTTDCSGALIGGAFYTTPTGTPYSISVGTPFGLTAEGAWNAGREKLALSLVEMGTVQSIAMTFMSTTSTVPQSDFSNNSFTCIQATCSAGPPGECTSSDGTKSFELKTTAAIGDPADGGVIGCMGGGLNDLVVPVADIADGIHWGGSGITTGATSNADGATNTSTIVDCLTNGTGNPGCTGSNINPSTYPAGLCSTYEAAGGFTSGWFLLAKNQLNCIYTNKDSLLGFSTDGYWSSTEANSTRSWAQSFFNGDQFSILKTHATVDARCARVYS